MALVGASINRLTGRPKLPVFGSVAAAAAPVADLLLDFANGVYRKDGVTASFASLGGTLTGGAAITPGSGLLCATAGDSAQIAYSFTGDYVLVFDHVSLPTPGAGVNAAGVLATSGFTRQCGAFRATDANYYQDVNNSSKTTAGAITKSVTGVSGGNRKTANNVNTTVFSAAASNMLAGATLTVGAAPAGLFSGSIDSPATVFIRSAAIYMGTFSDAQIQALAT